MLWEADAKTQRWTHARLHVNLSGRMDCDDVSVGGPGRIDVPLAPISPSDKYLVRIRRAANTPRDSLGNSKSPSDETKG